MVIILFELFIIIFVLSGVVVIYFLAFNSYYKRIYKEKDKRVYLNKAKKVKDSDDKIFASNFSAEINGIYVSQKIIGLEIYPKGIIVKPPILPPIALYNDEISNLEFEEGKIFAKLKLEHTCSEFKEGLINIRLLKAEMIQLKELLKKEEIFY